MITEYKKGDRVKISVESFQNIKNGNRSIHAFPCDSFVKSCFALMVDGVSGIVARRFLPGYEVNVQFDNGVILQMKDHWIVRA